MKKLFAVFVLIPSLALAATTWTDPSVAGARVSKAACTTGTEAAPSGSVGLDLRDIGGFAVVIETGGATSAGSLLAYIRNPTTGNWVRAPDLDLVVPASVTGYSWSGFTVTAPTGRIAYVPSGLGVAVDVYVNGTLRKT